MCGIVGYTGHENAKNIVIDGLKKLEYRGTLQESHCWGTGH